MKPAKVSKSKSTFSKLLTRPFEGKRDLLQGFGQRGVSGGRGVVTDSTPDDRKLVVAGVGPCEPPGSDLIKRRIANARYAVLNCPRRSKRWSSRTGSQAIEDIYTRAEPAPTYEARNTLHNGDIYPILTERNPSTTPHAATPPTKPLKWLYYVPDKNRLSAANGRTGYAVPARNFANVIEPACVVENSKVVIGVQDHEGKMDTFDNYEYSTRKISQSLAGMEHLVTEEDKRISVGMLRPVQGRVFEGQDAEKRNFIAGSAPDRRLLRPSIHLNEVSHWSADTEDITEKVEPGSLTPPWMTSVASPPIENIRTMHQEIINTFWRTRDISIEMGITLPDFDTIDSTPFQLGEDYINFMKLEQAGPQSHWRDDILKDHFHSGISDSSPSMTEEMFVLSDSAPTTPMESSCSTTLSPWTENAECIAQLGHNTIARPKVSVELAADLAPLGGKLDHSKSEIALKKARRLGFSNHEHGTSYPSSYNFKRNLSEISSPTVVKKLAPSPVLVERSKFNGSIASRTFNTPEVEDRRPSIRPSIPPLRPMLLLNRTNDRNLALISQITPPRFASNSVQRSGSRRYARQYIDFQKL